VIKYATNITDSKLKNAEFEGKIAAINRVQAVIELLSSSMLFTSLGVFTLSIGYYLSVTACIVIIGTK